MALLAAGIAAGRPCSRSCFGGSLVAQDERPPAPSSGARRAERAITAVYSDLGVDADAARRSGRPSRSSGAALGGRHLRSSPSGVLQYKLLRLERRAPGQPRRHGRARAAGCALSRRGGFPEERAHPRAARSSSSAAAGLDPSIPAGLRFVKVGEGRSRSPVPFGRSPGRARRASASPSGRSSSRLLSSPRASTLSRGSRPCCRLLPHVRLGRAARPGAVHPWEVDDFLASMSRARATLRSESLFLDVVAPSEQLEGARSSGEVAGGQVAPHRWPGRGTSAGLRASRRACMRRTWTRPGAG